MAVNTHVSTLVAICASWLCLQACSNGSYIPIFTVKKIKREVGQLFNLKITVKDGKDKDAKNRSSFDYISLELKQDGKESDLSLRQWGRLAEKSFFGGKYKEVKSDSGATRQYNDLYYLRTFSGTLVASVSVITYSGSNENSIPLEITASQGVTGVFTLNAATDKLTLQLSNAEAVRQYTIDLADNINYLDYGVAKVATTDADGKLSSSWPLTNKIDKRKVCETEFAAKVTNNDNDDTRIISTVIEFPCLREYGGDNIIVNSDGTVFFGNSAQQSNCRWADNKESDVHWSYAEYDKYPAGKTKQKANIDMSKAKSKLGSIADFKPDELCYYIVVKGKYKCSDKDSSIGGSINSRAVHGKCATYPLNFAALSLELPSPLSHSNRRLACFHLLQRNFECVSDTFPIGGVGL